MEQQHRELLHTLLMTLMREQGSDLHLSPGRKPFIRIHNELIPLSTMNTLEPMDTIGVLTAMVGPDRVKQLGERQELDFSYDFPEGHMRLRGNAFVRQEVVSIALRSIQKVKDFNELGLPAELLMEFTRKQQGFFLVVGPVGVGKSTTMSAMVDVINRERKEHIVTIEHPIEHIFEEKNSIIDQREVGIDTESFQSALGAVFRQDADVIMIGEMRTPETIATAVTAAETGHLVFSTLHTNNASQTIDRIIDSFPGDQQSQIRSQLANSLLGIFSQRLVPSLHGGLVPAYEFMRNTNATANLIREGRTHEIETVIETGYEQGMMSMNRSLAELVRRGDVAVEEAMRYSLNPRGLEQLL
ncbi:MAG: PilT/PilU family type 4a pilus ATPase [Candidatus Pacebacteria bacterium]|nr:PilT/PilU family type 4a pilus ATPase [Candidatus Paceibacterota bacterium]MCD8563454.1 PilT/PilU family type 4a pilus ATPase [Candidatus Paceibacterota bacterium]